MGNGRDAVESAMHMSGRLDGLVGVPCFVDTECSGEFQRFTRIGDFRSLGPFEIATMGQPS